MNITVVTFQTGCANNLLPIAEALARQDYKITIFSCGASSRVWEKSGLSFQDLDPDIDPEEVNRLLEKSDPLLVLTGSNAVNNFEFNFRRAGRDMEIPVVTMLDYWSKYRERFFDDEIGTESVPDLIMVADELARGELIGAGIDASKIRITGSPYFQKINKKYGALGTGKKRDELTILYLSQPLSDLYGSVAQSKSLLGYDEFSTMDSIMPILDKNQKPMKLIICPHPREDIARWKDYLERIGEKYPESVGKIHLAENEDLNSLLQNASLVLGLLTNSLIEASIMGKTAISLQFNYTGHFQFFGTVKGLITTFFTPEEFYDFFDDFIKNGSMENKKDLSYLYRNATENCLDTCLSLINQKI